ncbi:MAG: GyrI-like domain-containing protein [Caldilineaceae bacterium]
MTKIDFKKTHKHLYAPSPKDFVIVDVPAMHFLMIDGHGDPNTAQEYADAVEALYAVAYKLKFAVKKAAQVDYVVPPLEGLWWAEDMDTFTHARDKSAWDWTMMIMTPDWATPDLYEQAIAEVTAKKDLPRCPNYAWKATTKGCRRRSCTSARTTTKGLSWRAAQRVAAGQRLRGNRQAPRDLPQRSAAWPQRR